MAAMPERVLRADGGARRASADDRTWPAVALGVGVAGASSWSCRGAAARARLDRGAGRRHAGGRRCSGCRSRRSARASAASRAACRPSHIPAFRADLILPLLPAALTVALLAAVESLLSAVVADSMTGDRHNSNAELLAQGVANLVVPLVGGIPVTGAIARTATNFRAGARTPVAGSSTRCTLLVDRARARAAGRARPAGDAGGGPVRGGLQHGRVARDPGHLAAGAGRTSPSG